MAAGEFTFGTSIHNFGAGTLRLLGTAGHENLEGPKTYHVVSEPAQGGFTGGTADLGISWRRSEHTYFGIAGQVGGLGAGPLKGTSDNEGLKVTPTGVLYTSFSAMAGVKLPVGNWEFLGELALGREWFKIMTATEHGTCVLNESSTVAAYTVRPKVAVQRWVSPWITLGAGVGSNLVRRGDTSFSMFVGVHGNAFDGLRK